jgi:hypothetical protein
MQTHVYHSSAPKLAILPVLSPGSGSGASPRALPRHVREGPHFLGRHVVSIPPSSSATADHRLLTMRILALNPPNNNKLFDLISSIRPESLCAGSLASLRGSNTRRDETRLSISPFENPVHDLERSPRLPVGHFSKFSISDLIKLPQNGPLHDAGRSPKQKASLFSSQL